MAEVLQQPHRRRIRVFLALTGGLAILLLWWRSPKSQSAKAWLRVRWLRKAERFNLERDWWKLPLPIALANFAGMRALLRARNLHDTQVLPIVDPDKVRPADLRYLAARAPDGAFNDLTVPLMGSAGATFGRNAPLSECVPDERRLLAPNPRTVSQELLTRREFQPATTLNLLAAAWLQFQLHDWLSHGKNDKDRMIEVPLAADDPWPEHPMRVPRTRLETASGPQRPGAPPVFANTESHWWDGSQLYGSSLAIQQQVRSGEGGRLALTPDGLLPVDPITGAEVSGVTGNWWLGLSLMHTLFAREHNAICGMLRTAYPRWSDDTLFDHARLINVALMAKIHTVEWTPGILGTPALNLAMRGNWWGIAGERIARRYGRLAKNDLISGIVGSSPDHHGALYAMTEEFTAVYRMHPLIPDDYSFRSAQNNGVRYECTFRDVAFAGARAKLEEIGPLDCIYSFGTLHPGAITLHNYPRFLQHLVKPDSEHPSDMASIDILRDRERGVPRYNRFRELLHRPPVRSFEEITPNPQWAAELRSVYEGKLEDIDTMVGLYAESPPPGFGFSDTAFRIFILMASRRLKSDRFFTTDFTPEVYTPEGMRWIADNTMSTVLLRHFPALQPFLSRVHNAFAPWPRA